MVRHFTIYYSLFRIDLHECHVHLFACAKLPREPIFKICLQCLKVNAEAHFDQAIGYGKTVIESRPPRKTAHKEAIQPGYGARSRPTWGRYLHLDSACEHGKLSVHYLRVKKENQPRFRSGLLERTGGGWKGMGMSLITASGFFFNSLSAVSSPIVSATLR